MAAVDHLVGQVKTLSQKAEHVKASIYRAMHKEYNDLFPSSTQFELMKSVKPVLKEIQKLDGRFEKEIKPNIESATSQHKELLVLYEEAKTVTSFLQILCNCHRELTLCKACAPDKFVESAKYIQVIKASLDLLTPSNSTCDIKIFKVLRKEYINQNTKAINDITDMWMSLIVWTTSTSASWNKVDGHLKTSLKINLLPSDISMTDLIKGMDILGICNEKLKLFSHKIFTYLIKPLAKFKVLVPTVKAEVGYSVLTILKKVEHHKLQRSAHHVLVYQKIVSVINFVRSSLFHGVYASESGELLDVDPMKLIGSFIWNDVSEMLINDHLSADVPTTKSQMEKYEPIYEETVKFETALIKEGLIPPGTNKLTKYVSDVNIQFSNKVCQDTLSLAHDIMLYDIHNLIEVNPAIDRAAISENGEEGKELSKLVKCMFTNPTTIEEGFLQTIMFAFPVCRISDSVQKLLDFIYQNMINATESPYPIASEIYHCCRDVFELFVNVVPVYHKEALKLPQFAAVHYNNCMYLAHHCTTLGHQFRNSLPDKLKGAISTFIDYVPVLRKCGTECFLSQLQTQQQELIMMLQSCNTFVECTTKDGIINIERVFNQMIHHLTQLSKQWKTVLPENVFKLSIAILFNTVLENILSSIFRMEDISEEEAGQLHALLGVLVQHAPEIINDCASKDIGDTTMYDHIRSWVKFRYLIKLLDASLLEIVNLWDNDGELASCMNEGEVRSLIRALFQNTDQRSQALMKIKHKSERS